MKIIATDEAGYGPKLGPLVIGATLWDLPDAWANDSAEELASRFSVLKKKYAVGSATVCVDDSKAVFQPKSSTKKGVSAITNLHTTVSVANSWMAEDTLRFDEWIGRVAEKDIDAVKKTAWLADLPEDGFVRTIDIDEVAQTWSSTKAALRAFRGRVITAAQFNAACGAGANKADLLSQSTLGLVRDFMDHDAVAESGPPIQVYCDRHGGRRYYAGVLQHVFDGSDVAVVAESKQQSVYRMKYRDQRALIHFTVKGDSFTPVALSSIYAKYIRERMMQSMNAFFASHSTAPLRPTAGYPVDADRFLSDVDSVIRKLQIDREQFVRNR